MSLSEATSDPIAILRRREVELQESSASLDQWLEHASNCQATGYEEGMERAYSFAEEVERQQGGTVSPSAPLWSGQIDGEHSMLSVLEYARITAVDGELRLRHGGQIHSIFFKAGNIIDSEGEHGQQGEDHVISCILFESGTYEFLRAPVDQRPHTVQRNYMALALAATHLRDESSPGGA